jgi:hypothetical protein
MDRLQAEAERLFNAGLEDAEKRAKNVPLSLRLL